MDFLFSKTFYEVSCIASSLTTLNYKIGNPNDMNENSWG
jgi:hypothetical protein